MKLTKDHANKIVNIEHSPVVLIPAGEFSQGDALILFNNRDEFGTIQCEVPNSYRSGYTIKSAMIEFPPRCMMNAVFIDTDTVVFMRGMA
jgi:hypothetical protein